jgi:hypothetical protein
MTTQTGTPATSIEPEAPAPQHTLAVLSVLRYFEVFSYPLTEAEVSFYLPDNGLTATDLHQCLECMVETGQIWRFDGHFQSSPDPNWLPQRFEKNQRADAYLPKAYQMARFIGKFPFVRAVMVSGSLSKHCMAPDGDIDFFIVTAPKRLWLARTLLVVFKKIFLFNSHKYFCINYLIDTEHLEIEEKNRFTATECATLLPMVNADLYYRFMAANTWVSQDFYPNARQRNTDQTQPLPSGTGKKTLEWLFNGRLGQWADGFCMRFTVGFWRKKFRHFSEERFSLNLKSQRYVSKHHPLGFQHRVLQRYAELMER